MTRAVQGRGQRTNRAACRRLGIRVFYDSVLLLLLFLHARLTYLTHRLMRRWPEGEEGGHATQDATGRLSGTFVGAAFLAFFEPAGSALAGSALPFSSSAFSFPAFSPATKTALRRNLIDNSLLYYIQT